MTILEFAKTYNITKNKAKYYIRQMPDNMTYKDDKGTIHLTEECIQELIKTAVKPTTRPQENHTENQSAEIIEHLKQQISELQADKAFLQQQLQQANNRADFLTIQTLPFFKRRKALKAYNEKEKAL
jgi:hypothetical protein